MEAITVRTWIRGWWRRNSLNVTLIVLGIISLVAFLSKNIFISIHPGEAGVRWSRFFGGTITDKVHGEGIHVIFPWDIMYKYNVRFQRREATFVVLSSDGLRMETVFVVRFRPVVGKVALLHKHVGPDYVETLLLPEVGAHARERIAQYIPEEFYSQKRLTLQQEILSALQTESKIRYEFSQVQSTDFLFVEDVFIKTISLPEDVAESIRDKLSQQQHLEEYDYIVAREEKEKQRKRIEAEGIRLFQDIVTEGISDRYLRWKGIDATLALATSPNSKIVVIGAGEGGLPIILGNLEGIGGAAPQAASPAAVDPLQSGEPTVPSAPGLPPG